MPRILLLTTCVLLCGPRLSADQTFSADGRAAAARPSRSLQRMEVSREVDARQSSSADLPQSGRSQPLASISVDTIPAAVSDSNATTAKRRGESIRIPPPKSRSQDKQESMPGSSLFGGVAAIITSSLAIVIGLFLLLVWLSRRAMPRASSVLPNDVLEVLGKAPLAGRHQLQLIRLGRKLILISATSDGVAALSEIDDVEEVNRLVDICKRDNPGSITASFRSVLDNLSTPKSDGETLAATTRKKSYRTGPSVTRSRNVT